MDMIQKLLATEYEDFNDTVVLESPFAETTRDGYGIIQLQIGLTETELVVAVQRPADDPRTSAILELSFLAPLPAVALTAFRRKRRHTLKAHFANGVVRYFELAAPAAREKFWSRWTEKLVQLAPEIPMVSKSEGSLTSSASSNRSKNPTGGDKTWQHRDLFLGQEFGQGESKAEIRPAGTPHIPRVTEPEMLPLNRRNDAGRKAYPVNRFGAGVDERCSALLYLPVQISVQPDLGTLPLLPEMDGFMFKRERDKPWKDRIFAMPHHHFGLGVLGLTKTEAALTQLRKCSSSLSLPVDEDYIPGCEEGYSKRLLVSSISCESLLRYEKQHRPWILFWTPRLSYAPRSVTRSYSKLRNHLDSLKGFLNSKRKRKNKSSKRFSSKRNLWNREHILKKCDSKAGLREKLKLDIVISCWDFDSSIIASEITLIYRDLFLRIPVWEAVILVRERSAQNCPNWLALCTFSSRLTSLVTSEVLRMETVQMRARLMTRWANVADKLQRLQNLEGVTSVLAGLYSPALVLLPSSWAYLRRHHNSKYRRLEALCGLVWEPRSRDYGWLVKCASESGPYIPSAGYLVALLLGWAAPSIPQHRRLDKLWAEWGRAVASYRLQENHLAREFLLKSRFLAETDNLRAAISLENQSS